MPLRASHAMHSWVRPNNGVGRSISKLAGTFLIAVSALVLHTPLANAQSKMPEQVIYSFSVADDCFSPLAPLVKDAQGDLYGTALGGSESHPGCVFELSPDGDNTWVEKTIHVFDVNDGYQPGAALVFDRTGNLYSTADSGGLYGGGVVFELSPLPGGVWADTILYNFGRAGDGSGAASEAVFGPDGNLYGATEFGGSSGCGIVYSLSPGLTPSLGWEETILHDFADSTQDGCNPRGGLVFDSHGRVFGTTSGGGAQGLGTVYELTRSKDGSYQEQLIHNFLGADGSQPVSTLTKSEGGNLYGTTFSGGDLRACLGGCGTIFELSQSGGRWLEHILHAFSGSDGENVAASVTFDPEGSLYTATSSGGGTGFSGVILRLDPETNGIWKETILHRFAWPSTGDGAGPYAGVLLRDGELFGTTVVGGADNIGAVVSVDH
jgi:uncharacterized repeat protein (TIGR03803 family)